MITLTVTYQMPEDQDLFQQAHFNLDAWVAIDASMALIRNHFKHDAGGTAEAVLTTVQSILSEARSKIE